MNRSQSPVEQPELIRMIISRIPFEERASARFVNRKWNTNITYRPGEKLQWACQLGQLSIVERLLQDPHEDPSVNNNNAVRWAREFGHSKVVDRLLQDPRVSLPEFDFSELDCLLAIDQLLRGCRFDVDKALLWACDTGRTTIVDRLLRDPRTDPSVDDNCAVVNACSDGQVAVVARLLQDPRVDPSASDNMAVKWASRNGHLAIVDMLLRDPRVNPSADENEALCYACLRGNIAVANQLLQDPRVSAGSVDLYYVFKEIAGGGDTALEHFLANHPLIDASAVMSRASTGGDVCMIIRLMHVASIDPSADNNFAIRIASKMGHLRVVELLLRDPRIDPSALDNEAIRRANEAGHREVVKRLLQDPRVYGWKKTDSEY